MNYNKRVRILLCCFMILLTVFPLASLAFVDVKPKAWYANDVKVCVEKGYLAGTGNDRFSPNEPMTRAMFATVLYRMAGAPGVECENPFTDVKNKKWFTDGILWAYQAGIISGTSKTKFSPDAPITREQIASILYRIYGKNTQFAFRGNYTDFKDISSFALKGMAFASYFEYIKGSGTPGNMKLNPKGNATRAEVAAMLLRAEDMIMEHFDVYIKQANQELIVESNINALRDPCILEKDGIYYAYGTGWVCYENDSGSLAGGWKALGRVVTVPADCAGDQWAPEVHKYNGTYYMFTTYRSKETGHRGCAIFSSDSPTGPFVLHSEGHVTPSEWDSIDGTFYVDPDGQPWMVFVHEWTSTDDNVGRMSAAKLSDDLTHFVSEPIELFRADDPSWTDSNITDGCWMYRCEDGTLLMLWSNMCPEGYCVGIAKSANGSVTGPWEQCDDLLYSKAMTGIYDGGHGMLFYDTNGKMWLSIHSPNQNIDDRAEKPVFIPVKEENGMIVWDKDKRTEN